MSAQDNGGPAFPVLEQGGNGLELGNPGMTLRDYFAAKAMQSLIQLGATVTKHTLEGTLTIPARQGIPPIAYEYADAMLNARQL